MNTTTRKARTSALISEGLLVGRSTFLLFRLAALDMLGSSDAWLLLEGRPSALSSSCIALKSFVASDHHLAISQIGPRRRRRRHVYRRGRGVRQRSIVSPVRSPIRRRRFGRLRRPDPWLLLTLNASLLLSFLLFSSLIRFFQPHHLDCATSPLLLVAELSQGHDSSPNARSPSAASRVRVAIPCQRR